MEDEHSGIPYMCRTEHPGSVEAGEQTGKGSGSDSPGSLDQAFQGSAFFFKRPQEGPSCLLRSTCYLSCLICF